MIPRAAIEKAKAAGYELPWITRKQIAKLSRDELCRIALDPSFWQALGKALGWHKQPYMCEGCQTIGTGRGNHMNECPTKYRYGDWDTEALRFYEIVLRGGDTQKFWDELLTV